MENGGYFCIGVSFIPHVFWVSINFVNVNPIWQWDSDRKHWVLFVVENPGGATDMAAKEDPIDMDIDDDDEEEAPKEEKT